MPCVAGGERGVCVFKGVCVCVCVSILTTRRAEPAGAKQVEIYRPVDEKRWPTSVCRVSEIV